MKSRRSERTKLTPQNFLRHSKLSFCLPLTVFISSSYRSIAALPSVVFSQYPADLVIYADCDSEGKENPSENPNSCEEGKVNSHPTLFSSSPHLDHIALLSDAKPPSLGMTASFQNSLIAVREKCEENSLKSLLQSYYFLNVWRNHVDEVELVVRKNAP